MKNLVLIMSCLLFIGISFSSNATVDTASIYSNSMHKEIKTVVIKPASYEKFKGNFPVVYLLHGYSDTYSGWIKKVPSIQRLADEDQLIIVCPDGGFSSWYFDSPIDSNYRYETFVSTEVPNYIDANYHTIKDRKGRAITGLSMGGHGGLFIGYRHSDEFGACGSMSGGVDLSYSVHKFDVAKRIGDSANFPDNWKKYSVMNLVDNVPKQPLAIIFDCGVDDFFYENNKALHQKLVAMKVKHDYIERPGKHEWSYWSNAIEYQLLFFKKYFYSG